jgi:hypothetical protein
MGSFARFPVRGRWALFVALAAACSSRALLPLPDAATIEPDSIKATSDTVAIPPFGSRLLVFYLLGRQGEAVPGVVMNFSILDDPKTPGSGGAQLSFASALTDGDGAVTLQVIAGQGASGPEPLTFKVEASAEGVADPPKIPIFVTTSPLATVEILPVIVDRSPIDNSATTTNIYFYDDTSCASVSLAHPAPPMRRVQTLSLDDPPATFTNVVTSGVHAILGLAVNSNQRVVAQGCSDLLGASLSSDRLMLVQLPLTWIYPSPVGSFHAVSQFSLAPPLPGAVSAQDTWKDLSSYACDPARLWLDCTIDALSGTSAEDPLDCQPVPGNEGPLGALLADRRAATGGASTCADQLDGSGRPSLDAEVYALFPATSLSALRLKRLPDELGNALASLTIESTLTVTANGPPNAFNIDHALTAIELPNAAVPSSIAMTSLAPPVWEAAFVSGVSGAGQLDISTASNPHGFTLELGSAARFTFAASSLVPRLGVADVGAFVEALANLATRNENGTTLRGCDALDSLLCAEVGRGRGCVSAACLSGLQALIQRLDASFAALDGQDLDFFLSGSAQIVDWDGDGHADALGCDTSVAASSSSTLVGPGLWLSIFKSRTGTTKLYGSWTAERTSAPGQ